MSTAGHRPLQGLAGDLNRVLSILLAGIAIGLAVAVAATSKPVPVLWQSVFGVVGWIFPVLLCGLVAVGLLALVRLRCCRTEARPKAFWRQTGLQAASCTATLALTCTLLGISLGIGALAETPLTPGTVTVVVAELTDRFGMAFMTTVIGLPVSALMRAAILILAASIGTEEGVA